MGLALGLEVVNFGGASPEKWAAASTDGEVYEELDNMLADNGGRGNRRLVPFDGSRCSKRKTFGDRFHEWSRPS